MRNHRETLTKITERQIHMECIREDNEQSINQSCTMMDETPVYKAINTQGYLFPTQK